MVKILFFGAQSGCAGTSLLWHSVLDALYQYHYMDRIVIFLQLRPTSPDFASLVVICLVLISISLHEQDLFISTASSDFAEISLPN